MKQNNPADGENPAKRDIIVTRIIDAPIEKVWKAWTDPEKVSLWWGPKEYTSPDCKIDLHVGGKYIFSMQAPKDQGNQVYYTGGVYKKIIPLERLEFTQGLADKDGNRIEAALAGMPPDFPKEILTEVVFRKARCDMTGLTVTEKDWPVSQMFVYSIAGLHQSIDKLTESLSQS